MKSKLFKCAAQFLFSCLFSCLFTSGVVQAAPAEWQIIPRESRIIFTGVQNGVSSSGSFKKFSGQILVDPNDIKTANVNMSIDVTSVYMPYKEFAETLRSSDWFSALQYPYAVFKATHFVKIGNMKYEAIGTLTIRNKTFPIKIYFSVRYLSKTKVEASGGTLVKRSLFGVGQGEWGDMSTVRDEVAVSFVLTAEER